MNIAIFGLSYSSSWGNGHATTWRALMRGLHERGHHVTFFERDVPWYASNRDLDHSAHGDLVFYSSLHPWSEIANRLVDADAIVLGSYVPEGVALARRLIALDAAPLAFYDIDTPVTLAKLAGGDEDYLAADTIPHFDVYLSFSGGDALTILQRQWGARLAVPFYCGVDTGLYRPLSIPARWDLGYLGTWAADRQPTLDRLLLEPARRMPERRFVVAGPQYPPGIAWPDNVERIDHVPPPEHPAFYARCRYTLNVTREAMIELGHSPSVRLFEAGACGAAILTDRWRGIEEVFEPGRELLIVDRSEDVTRLLQEESEPLARRLGRAARERVLRDHTAGRRAQELEHWLAVAHEGRTRSGRAAGMHRRREPALQADGDEP
ncbi:MAG: glycosyltransferase [Geminicoccaceae bacterium]|nr:glycosyltransferase [Geminicoccaceae bacterium]